MTYTNATTLVETVAKAIHDYDPVRCWSWEEMDGEYRETRLGQARAVIDALAMTPGRWWRAVGPDGSVWCESSSESEVRSMARPDDQILQLWRGEVASWRPAEVTA